MYFWNLRARVRAGVGESRERGVTLGSVCCPFCIWQSWESMLIWSRNYTMWKEVSFGERLVSCGQLMPRICLLCAFLWGLRWKKEAAVTGFLNCKNVKDLPTNCPWQWRAEEGNRSPPTQNPERCRRQLLSVPVSGSGVWGLIEDTGNRRASLVAQTVKNLPAVQETWVHSLGWEIPLEKGIVTHSNILAWGIPWTEEPGGLQSLGSQSHTWLSD